MDIEKVIKFIDKSIDEKENYNELIIKELIKDKNGLIPLLVKIDIFYFLYILKVLDEVILILYSKDFISEFKRKIYIRYDKLSNINVNNHETIKDKCNN
ncbi:hypothetical protein SAMN04487886_10395 [Clostridium sp. DSM 8431]|uniref:ORF; putative n=1 Tax=Clostridium longisporum TaxID=1523 RepID=Q46131_CLOLO|nr:hypothetical protein [Clostridium sp. DSM 8431]AAC05715.1 ORF; putative [Clostridium longisporum]SFU48760.1 hypothetical protein SAMN04487886_10395 [Clostridium sp. DSM 8431]